MRAEELRIGNYVIDEFGDCRKILHLNKSSVEFDYGIIDMYENLKSVPLTEDWLLKFGFIKLEGWDDTFFFQLNNVQILEYNISGYDYDDFNIKNVHQLQNLYFALTGEELTIK